MSHRDLAVVGAFLAFGCTVDQVVGILATDGGTQTCAGQVCTPGCGDLQDCEVENGASVGFECEASQACAPACTPADGPCREIILYEVTWQESCHTSRLYRGN